jgi:hypothetical protein
MIIFLVGFPRAQTGLKKKVIISSDKNLTEGSLKLNSNSIKSLIPGSKKETSYRQFS